MNLRTGTLTLLGGAALLAAACVPSAFAQAMPPTAVTPAQTSAPAPAAAVRVPPQPSYFDPSAINPALIIGPPPTPGTPEEASDLAEVHRLYDPASPELVKFAQDDARGQNIFLYSTIFGPGFNAQALPLTAKLGANLIKDAGIENQILKAHFQHPRPYRIDATLPSRCGVDQSFSYPSGHSMAAYLTAFVMQQIVPEKAPEILTRADEFAQHRVVCAVHFVTDIRAGKLVSLEMYGYMQSNPRFQQDVNAARAEIRAALHLAPQ